MTLSAVVLLLSSDAYEFSWRYQLPAVVMLPVAGALGLTALAAQVGHTRDRTRAGLPRYSAGEDGKEQTIPLRGTDKSIR